MRSENCDVISIGSGAVFCACAGMLQKNIQIANRNNLKVRLPISSSAAGCTDLSIGALSRGSLGNIGVKRLNRFLKSASPAAIFRYYLHVTSIFKLLIPFSFDCRKCWRACSNDAASGMACLPQRSQGGARIAGGGHERRQTRRAPCGLSKI